jgi:hypothetical protein
MKAYTFRSLIGLFFLFAFVSAQAQKPVWVEEAQRNLRYPSSTYLTGFSVAKNNLNEAGDEFMNKMVEVARTELINSIYTNLQSLSSLNIENKNTQTNEVYRLKTASFSKASLSGLEVKKYYDAPNRTAYAFAFARKAEVTDYNRRLINENKTKIDAAIQRGQSFKSAGNAQQALKAFYEGLTLLRNVETAQSVLLALNVDLNQLPHRQAFNQYAIDLKQEIESLQKSEHLQLDDVAYFLAYGLHLQLGKTEQALLIQPLTYQNKGFESPFSQQLSTLLKNQLIEAGQYKVQLSSSEEKSNQLLIKGSYWEDGEKIRVIALAEDPLDGTIRASAEAGLSLQQISEGRQAIIPAILQKVAQLQSIRLKALNPRLEGKVNQMDRSPANVQLSGNASTTPLSDIPILFLDPGNGQVLARARSNQQGIASGILEQMTASSNIQFVEAMVDIPSFLQLSTQDPRLDRLKAEIPVEKTRFMLKVSGLSVQMEALETDAGGRALSTPILGPKIKNALLKEGYAFTEDYNQADLYINIQANAKDGKSFSGLYFSYVDATISVVDLQSSQEIYSNTFENVKGGGGSFDQATVKAFQSIADTIITDLKDRLKP